MEKMLSNYQKLSEESKKLCWRCGESEKTEDHKKITCEQTPKCNNCEKDNHMTMFCKQTSKAWQQEGPFSSNQDSEDKDAHMREATRSQKKKLDEDFYFKNFFSTI